MRIYVRSFTVPSWKWMVAALSRAAFFLCAGKAEAEAIIEGDWEYEPLNDNEAVITKYNGGGGHVDIPKFRTSLFAVMPVSSRSSFPKASPESEKTHFVAASI